MVWLNNNFLYTYFLAFHVHNTLGYKFKLKLSCIWYNLPWLYFTMNISFVFSCRKYVLEKVAMNGGYTDGFSNLPQWLPDVMATYRRRSSSGDQELDLSCMTCQSHLHLWPSPTKALQHMGIIPRLLHGLEQVIWLYMTHG